MPAFGVCAQVSRICSLDSQCFNSICAAEVDQNTLPQNMLLGYKDYFELKTIENKQIQEALSAFPCLPQSSTYVHLVKVFSPSNTRKRRTTLITRDGDSSSLSLHKQTLINNSYLPLSCLHIVTSPRSLTHLFSVQSLCYNLLLIVKIAYKPPI